MEISILIILDITYQILRLQKTFINFGELLMFMDN